MRCMYFLQDGRVVSKQPGQPVRVAALDGPDGLPLVSTFVERVSLHGDGLPVTQNELLLSTGCPPPE